MDEAQRKEQFSNAYLQAVAPVAGYWLTKPPVDDDSVDWIVGGRGAGGTLRRPRVEVQLKCTARDILYQHDLRFPLSRKNYDDLRDPDLTLPRLLVVVLVPEQIDDWLAQTEAALVLRVCGYWVSLRGAPPRSSASTNVTVRIPRAQILDVAALQTLMARVSRKEDL